VSDTVDPSPEGTSGDRMPAWIPRLIVVLVLTVFGSLFAWHLLGVFSGLIRTLFLALFLSFAFEPGVTWLAARGWRRGPATALLLFGVVVLGMALVGLMIPVVVKQVGSLINTAPAYIDKLAKDLRTCCNIDLSTQHVTEELQNAKASVGSYAANLAGNLLGFGAAILGGLFQIFTIGLFLFYFVAQGPQLRRTICSMLPARRQRDVLRAWEIAIDKTGGYFYSRLLLAVINGGLTFVVLLLLGVPFALPLAVFEGVVAEFIPIVGTYVAAVVPLFVCLFARPWPITLVLVGWFVLYQQIENYVLSPRISAKTMQLHPAVAFAAAIAGASLGGILWAFLALPVAATIQAAASAYIKRHDVVQDDLTEDRKPEHDAHRSKRTPGQSGARRMGKWLRGSATPSSAPAEGDPASPPG
jgi:predicted PurR-regulated permease PerM